MVPRDPENQANGFVLDENGELDFADLEAEYEVPFEVGFDSVILVDNCPIVNDEDRKGKLVNYIRKTFSVHGTIKEDGIYMPMATGEDGKPTSQGYICKRSLIAGTCLLSLQPQNRPPLLSRQGMDIHWIRNTS